MMSIPYMLQVANGMTWLPLRTNIVGLCLFGPAVGLFIVWRGLPGAALAWLMYNIFYVAIIPHIMFKHLLFKEKSSWYWHDNMGFLFCGMTAFGLWRSVAHFDVGRWVFLIPAGAAIVTYFSLVFIFYKSFRVKILDKVTQLIKT